MRPITEQAWSVAFPQVEVEGEGDPVQDAVELTLVTRRGRRQAWWAGSGALRLDQEPEGRDS